MSKYKDRFDENYQKLVGQFLCEPALHDNSKEMVEVLDRHGVIRNGIHVFEIGSGGARNLKYINDHNPTVKLSANDLYRDASFAEMDESIKTKINFYEQDTVSLMQKLLPEPIDLLIASDHLMHIDPESVAEIVAEIVNKWSPQYILLREVKPNGHRVDRQFPRMCHTFDFGPMYQVVEEIDSRSTPHLYYVRLLKRIQPT